METTNCHTQYLSWRSVFKTTVSVLLLSVIGYSNAQTSTPQRELIRFKLESTSFSDQTVLYLQEGATLGFDSKYDAYKFLNPSINIYTSPDSKLKLSINAIPSTIEEELIPLHFSTKQTGVHHLRITQHVNAGMYAESYLIDTYTGASMLIALNEVYDFTINKEDSARVISDRFVVHVQGKRANIVTSMKDQSLSMDNAAEVSPNPMNDLEHLRVHMNRHATDDQISIEIDNSLGKEVNRQDLPYSEDIDLDYTQSLDAGVYFVHIKQGKDVNVCKRVIKN